jgi:pyruvate/2-oxoglutarate/acetoin dehydrogenase E1 component
MVQSINLALKEEMADDRVLILGEMSADGGVFRVTDGRLTPTAPTVIDTPLATVVGTAIALYGLRPVAEIQFKGFITRR